MLRAETGPCQCNPLETKDRKEGRTSKGNDRCHSPLFSLRMRSWQEALYEYRCVAYSGTAALTEGSCAIGYYRTRLRIHWQALKRGVRR